MSDDLLFELGTEELPSAAVLQLSEALVQEFAKQLDAAGLGYQRIQRFASPRRLALIVEALEAEQPAKRIQRRGPACEGSLLPTGEPGPALLGFARSCGVAVSDLQRLQTEKGEWWGFETLESGAKTEALLPALLEKAIANLPIAKPMRWGNFDVSFVRPVHWAVLLYGEQVIRAKLLAVETGNSSFGHRFHHPEAIILRHAREYEAKLEAAKVIVSFEKRRERMLQQIQALAATKAMTAQIPEALLQEVCSIVEWPEALLASFDPEFLQVPAEALIAAMQQHQKCFALRDAADALAPYFIAVANIQSGNQATVISGNERVMRARLSDAAFFFAQDRKRALQQYYPDLARVLFQKDLGSLQDKSRRIGLLMAAYAEVLQLSGRDCERAAYLAKTDLMTGMVNEFPELQGLMGYHYALHDGEGPLVAKAMEEQYLPRFAGDSLPGSDLGWLLALCDRVDTLVGNFALGLKPNGMKDPFKLRRQALAVARLLLNARVPISLSGLLAQGLAAYGDSLQLKQQDCLAELKTFVLERLQAFYQQQGIKPAFLAAVLARQDDCLADLELRLQALQAFAASEAAVSLSAASKRVSNLLQQVDSNLSGAEIKPDRFQAAEEMTLYQALLQVEANNQSHFENADYAALLSGLAELKEAVDAFFDKVMVLVEDPLLRQNRLCLLAGLQVQMQAVADIAVLAQL